MLGLKNLAKPQRELTTFAALTSLRGKRQAVHSGTEKTQGDKGLLTHQHLEVATLAKRRNLTCAVRLVPIKASRH